MFWLPLKGESRDWETHMCNLWPAAVCATALWAIGVAAAIYEPAKRLPVRLGW